MARKRFVRILLIPILAPIFLIGWLLAFFGEHKVETKKSDQRTAAETNEGAVEIGVMPEMKEAPLEVSLKADDSA